MFVFGIYCDNSWQYLMILCDTWQYLAILGNTRQYPTILLLHFPILNNTFQFLTIFNNTIQYLPIPNNTWQTLYWLVLPGINRASSITANMIPVSWRYRHDTVLTVFCLSGIITVPILAIFTKPFDA